MSDDVRRAYKSAKLLIWLRRTSDRLLTSTVHSSSQPQVSSNKLSSLALAAAALTVFADATYIKKWNLQGCPENGVNMRCNSLPSGHCCDKGQVSGGSVQIANLPSAVDISVPYSGRSGGGSNEETRCASPKLSQIRFGDINCYSNVRVGTGIWIHCSAHFDPTKCLDSHSHPGRSLHEDEYLDLSPLEQQGHPGYIDEEEAALPPISYHDSNGDLISEERFLELSELEKQHEANGTLHLLYPASYPPDYMFFYNKPAEDSSITSVDEDEDEKAQYPRSLDGTKAEIQDLITTMRSHESSFARTELETRAAKIQVAAYVSNQCRGDRLGVATKKGQCITATNGASIELVSLPGSCFVDTYPQEHCKGAANEDVGKGASPGCYDDDNFTSFKVRCN